MAVYVPVTVRVYVPAGEKTFKRVEVSAGKMVPPNLQEIVTGLFTMELADEPFERHIELI